MLLHLLSEGAGVGLVGEVNLGLLRVVNNLNAGQVPVLLLEALCLRFLLPKVANHRYELALLGSQLLGVVDEFSLDTIVKRSDLVLQILDELFVAVAGEQFVLDGAHVVEAAGEDQVEEFNELPVLL